MKLRILIAVALAGLAAQAHAVGNLVDVTVFDRTRNVRLPVHWHEGRAYVAGQPGNEYSVSVRSRQGGDVLAVMSVDGVNVITGETANPSQSGYVLSSYRSMDVQGWRKNMGETAAFYFTSLGDSYAARTGRPNDVGAIGVAVFRRKAEPPPVSQPLPIAPPVRSEGSPPARSEAPSARRDAAADAAPPAAEARANGELSSSAGAKAQSAPPVTSQSAPLGTGHGRRESSQARYVGFERASADPVETIVLYYDSRANLVARGILREPVPVAPRNPNPFPGFVPDPVSVAPMRPVRPSFDG